MDDLNRMCILKKNDEDNIFSGKRWRKRDHFRGMKSRKKLPTNKSADWKKAKKSEIIRKLQRQSAEEGL